MLFRLQVVHLGYPAGLHALSTFGMCCIYPPHLQAVDNLMPGFDKEIARTAQRLLINPRRIDYHTGVLATKVTPGVIPALTSLAPMSLLFNS